MPQTKRTVGHPSRIDQTVRIDPDGREITVAEAIIERLEQGDYVEHAAAFCGVNKTTIYEWEKVAARALIHAHGDPTATDPNPHIQACIQFSNAIGEATARAHARALDTVQLLALGGIQQETVTVKVRVTGEGDEETEQEIERTTRTAYTLPNDRVLTWWLERRFPDLYGARLQLEDRREPLSQEDRAQALLETARAAQDRRGLGVPRAHRPARKATKK